MEDRDKDDFSGAYEINSHRAHLSAYVLIAGLVLELINAVAWYKGVETLAEMAAVLLIVGGVWGEIFFGHRARIAGDKQLAQYETRTAEANERAAKADLARMELETKLAPRSLTQEQFSILQKLRGKISTVNIAAEVDLEPSWFATQIANALQKAGIDVRIFWRGPHAHSSSNMLFDAQAFNNLSGSPTQGEPLASILKEAGIWDGGLLAVMPLDINGPVDIPMLIIAGRFPFAPKPPYFGHDNKSAMPPLTMIDRMKAP